MPDPVGGNEQPQIALSEHDASGGVDTKRILVYGWNAGTLTKIKLAVNSNGYVQINTS